MATKARQELAQQGQEITSTGKKVGQKSSSSYSEEISSPANDTQSRQEASPSSLLDFSPYSQQKQRDNISATGSLLSVYV
jgi:hypothetical protein